MIDCYVPAHLAPADGPLRWVVDTVRHPSAPDTPLALTAFQANALSCMRERVPLAGRRRSGRTTGLCLRALYRAAAQPGARVLLAESSHRMADHASGVLGGLIAVSPDLRPVVGEPRRMRDRIVNLANGSTLVVAAATPASLRGHAPFDEVLVDDADYLGPAAWAPLEPYLLRPGVLVREVFEG